MTNPKGTAVFEPPPEDETPEHVIRRIFGMTPEQMVESLRSGKLAEVRKSVSAENDSAALKGA